MAGGCPASLKRVPESYPPSWRVGWGTAGSRLGPGFLPPSPLTELSIAWPSPRPILPEILGTPGAVPGGGLWSTGGHRGPAQSQSHSLHRELSWPTGLLCRLKGPILCGMKPSGLWLSSELCLSSAQSPGHLCPSQRGQLSPGVLQCLHTPQKCPGRWLRGFLSGKTFPTLQFPLD